MKISKKKHLRKITKNKTTNALKDHDVELLAKLEQRLSLNVDSFLVLSEEGDPTQVALAYQKAKNEYQKVGPKMHRIAMEIGGDFPSVVADFLESIDRVLHGKQILDEDVIMHCLDTTARLKAELRGGRHHLQP